MNEDETKNLSEDRNKTPTTNPMLEAILARVTDGFSQTNQRLSVIADEIASFHTELTSLKTELTAFRADTEKNFKLVNNKFSILTDQMLEV